MSAEPLRGKSLHFSKFHWTTAIIAAMVLGAAFFFLVNAAHAGAGNEDGPQELPEALIFTDTPIGLQKKEPHAVIIDKSRQVVMLFEYKGKWHLVHTWPCSTGKRKGRKQAEGDSKTPEGVYFITRHVAQRFLSDTYGSRALPLDFPNWLDRHQKRTGSAIWLHGTNKKLRPYDSNGCVVMMNDDIDALVRYIQIERTPVIIVGKLHWQTEPQAQNLADRILQSAEQWHSALMTGSFEQFKTYYDVNAIPAMQWWVTWRDVQNRYRFHPGHVTGHMVQRGIFRDKEMYVLIFDHYLETGGERLWAGRRKLYLQDQDGRICVTGDTYQDPSHDSEKNPAKKNDDLDPLLDAWRRIWQKKGGSPLMADQGEAGQ